MTVAAAVRSGQAQHLRNLAASLLCALAVGCAPGALRSDSGVTDVDGGDADAGSTDSGGDAGTRPMFDSQMVRVDFVPDGDTVVMAAGPSVRTPDGRAMDGELIRFLGIDAPETEKPNAPGECHAEEAQAYLDGLIGGRIVELVFDETNCNPQQTRGCRGEFDRLLAYVRFQGRIVNEDMLRLGHARVLRGFTHRDTSIYNDLEREARNQDVGLWACP